MVLGTVLNNQAIYFYLFCPLYLLLLFFYHSFVPLYCYLCFLLLFLFHPPPPLPVSTGLLQLFSLSPSIFLLLSPFTLAAILFGPLSQITDLSALKPEEIGAMWSCFLPQLYIDNKNMSACTDQNANHFWLNLNRSWGSGVCKLFKHFND